MITHITLPIPGVAKGRPRFTRQGHAFTPAKTRAFEDSAATLLRSLYPLQPRTGALRVTFRFVVKAPKRCSRMHPTVKPDVLNLAKAIEDAGNGILWLDDAQLCDVRSIKVYDMSGGQPRIEIEMEEM
jgi:Holliday junction resolvase RusA-like endonuclease